MACSWCIPDIKIIWYSIECQSGKTLDTVTVVVQCDGSQGDSCGEYEQQLITSSKPYIIISRLVLLLSNVRISQYKLVTITVEIAGWGYSWWYLKTTLIPHTISACTLSSIDRVIVGILRWVHLTRGSICYTQIKTMIMMNINMPISYILLP